MKRITEAIRFRQVAAAALALALSALPTRAAEYALGFGIVGAGVGASFHCQPEKSHWRFGFEYGRLGTDTFDDPYTGEPLTEEDGSLMGPFVHYQFDAEARRGWYVGASLLRWSRTETSLTFGDTSKSSSLDPYFGGGYLARWGNHAYFNGGMFIAPSASAGTETSTSSTENGGNFDIQLTFGVRF